MPSATIVKPTSNSLIPKFFAILEDDSTNLSAPYISVAIDIIRREILINTYILYRFN